MGFFERVALFGLCVLATSFIVSTMVLPFWRDRCGLQVAVVHEDNAPYYDHLPEVTAPSPSSRTLPWYRPHLPTPRTTRIVKHAPGWTIFENLYMSNGTFLVVSDLPSDELPERQLVISSHDNFGVNTHLPTERNIQYITSAEAARRWPSGVWAIQGNSFIFHDPLSSRLADIVTDTFMGAWRFWTGTYDPSVSPTGYTTAPPINRIVYPHSGPGEWRDLLGHNAFFLASAWSSASIEEKAQWTDRAHATRQGDKAWMYDRVLLNDVAAASRGSVVYAQERSTAAEAFEATVETSSPFWWEPVRRSVLMFVGVEQTTLDIALHGPEESEPPVVTYLSSQTTSNHKLEPSDHDALVLALEQLCGAKGWELHVIDAHSVPREDQLQLLARTTVLLGTASLDHLLFMPPTRFATVIEIARAHEFQHEWTSRRALGFKHFAVRNDTWYTSPSPGFQSSEFVEEGNMGSTIPLHAETVADIIERRLEGLM